MGHLFYHSAYLHNSVRIRMADIHRPHASHLFSNQKQAEIGLMKPQHSWVLILAVLLSGCGGGSGEPEQSIPLPASPSNLSATVVDGSVTLTWDASPDAQTHHIYYAHEPISDPENYAAHDGGTWLRDVSSPLTIPLDDPVPVYRFIATAESDTGESEPSSTVAAIVRYRITGPTVIDLTTGLEWMRCSNGQVWNSITDECDGELVRANFSEIQSATPIGWGIPTVEQFQTLGLCDSGPLTMHFQIPGEPCDPRGEHGIYSPAFPPSSFGSESIYITSTISLAPNILRGFSFSVRGGNLPGVGIPYLDPGIGVYARFVRPAATR